jgi:hypothetical protein
MVDTNVVIYAMRTAKPDDKPDLRAMLTMSTDLLRRLDKISISAITHVEVTRALRPNERENPAVQGLFRRLHIMPVTAAAAERAVELLSHRNANEKSAQGACRQRTTIHAPSATAWLLHTSALRTQ